MAEVTNEQRIQDAIALACKRLSSSNAPKLRELAVMAGLSESGFQRRFTQAVGVSPKSFAHARRGERVRRHLRDGASVTDAIYGSGFGASSRFYEQAQRNLGMAPAKFKKGGDGETIYVAVARCYLGHILIAATARGICCVEFGDSDGELRGLIETRFPNAAIDKRNASFSALVKQVVAALKAPKLAHKLPLDVQGTAFQRRVWDALREIPAGETRSYSQVARRIGKPKAVRAVASACARNKIAVLIPCHRVIGSDGTLTGYAGGLARKRRLLAKEGAPRYPD